MINIFKNCDTNTIQGNLGLGRAIYEIQKMGAIISLPITENQKYDLVADLKNKLNKIQIKTTGYKKKSCKYAVNLKTSGGNQSFNKATLRKEGDYDYLFVLCSDDECFFIPETSFSAKNELTLSDKFDKYKLNGNAPKLESWA